jgi:hypothetical protein
MSRLTRAARSVTLPTTQTRDSARRLASPAYLCRPGLSRPFDRRQWEPSKLPGGAWAGQELPDTGTVGRRDPRTRDLAGDHVDPLRRDLRALLIHAHHQRHEITIPSQPTRHPRVTEHKPGAQGMAYREPRLVPPIRLASRVAATTRAFRCRSTRRAGHLTGESRQPVHDTYGDLRASGRDRWPVRSALLRSRRSSHVGNAFGGLPDFCFHI